MGFTALERFWPESDAPLVLAGEWCIPEDHRHICGEDLPYILPYHFSDRGRFLQAIQLCSAVVEDFLDRLVPVLNSVHEVSWKPVNWRIVLGPWLNHFVQVLYDRYLTVSVALERFPHFEAIGLSSSSFLIPASTEQFVKLCTDDPYNLQLFTQILEALGRPVPSLDLALAAQARGIQHHQAGWKRGIKGYLGQASRLKLWKSLSNRCPVWSYKLNLPLRDHWRLITASGFSVWPMETDLAGWVDGLGQTPTDQARRSEIGRLLNQQSAGTIGEFGVVLARSIHQNLPKALVEGFSDLRTRARDLLSPGPRVMVSSVGYELSDPWTILASEARDLGRRLVGVQHGGGYGAFSYHPIEEHELRTLDEWWTWGWEVPESSAALPLVSAKPKGIRPKPLSHRDDGDLLVVVNNFPRYLYRFWTNPIGPGARGYRELLVTFLEAIEKAALLPRTLLRLHHNDWGTGQRDRLTGRFPAMRIDDHSVSYQGRLARARLVVCDNNHTTILEALLSGVPTVAFWDPGQWEVRADAEGLYDSLREAEILHDSPASAARVIASIWPNVEEWWEQSERAEARRAFLERFCRTSPGWPATWARRLREIARAL